MRLLLSEIYLFCFCFFLLFLIGKKHIDVCAHMNSNNPFGSAENKYTCKAACRARRNEACGGLQGRLIGWIGWGQKKLKHNWRVLRSGTSPSSSIEWGQAKSNCFCFFFWFSVLRLKSSWVLAGHTCVEGVNEIVNYCLSNTLYSSGGCMHCRHSMPMKCRRCWWWRSKSSVIWNCVICEGVYVRRNDQSLHAFLSKLYTCLFSKGHQAATKLVILAPHHQWR